MKKFLVMLLMASYAYATEQADVYLPETNELIPIEVTPTDVYNGTDNTLTPVEVTYED